MAMALFHDLSPPLIKVFPKGQPGSIYSFNDYLSVLSFFGGWENGEQENTPKGKSSEKMSGLPGA